MVIRHVWSTSVIVDMGRVFQVHRNHRYIEGLRVKYRAVADPADARSMTSLRSRRGDIMMAVALPGMTSFVLRSLQKYTW